MSLSLIESQAISEIASLFYDFLPGTPHPYANKEISFEGTARELGLSQFWTGGSKLPSITLLLEKTIDLKRSSFCDLIITIVRKGFVYRKKKNPIKKEEILKLNTLLLKVQFKIPELWNTQFLESLPSDIKSKPVNQENKLEDFQTLKQDLIALHILEPHARGFAFEKFLNKFFEVNNLSPKGAFRLVGEQIDGSFEINSTVYLLEAKWQKNPLSHEQLLVFREKVESKSTWSRGLFISESGYTKDGLNAFSKGRSTNIIGMTGQDIYFILDGKIPLIDVINRKSRHAAETGEFYISVFQLING